MNIFVARLDYDTRSEDLRNAFEQFGEVSSAKVIFDKFTGNSRGFGFVEMDNDQEAMDAIEALNDTELDGRRIVVKKAKPRGDRGGSSRDRGRSSGGGYNRW
jgi:RNA recognition motif-containing protein